MKAIESQLHELNATQHEIMGALLSHKPEATLADFRQLIDISEQALRKNLNTLTEKHIIEKVTTKLRDKNAIYRFKSR